MVCLFLLGKEEVGEGSEGCGRTCYVAYGCEHGLDCGTVDWCLAWVCEDDGKVSVDDKVTAELGCILLERLWELTGEHFTKVEQKRGGGPRPHDGPSEVEVTVRLTCRIDEDHECVVWNRQFRQE